MLGLAIILPSIVDDTRSFRSVIWASALASLCFGIAIISVPVYLDLFVPIAAVSLLCLGILRKRETNSLRHRLRNVLWLALAWSIPAAALVSAVYVPLLGTIQKDMFYVGEPTWWSAYTRYLIATFQYVCTQDYLTFIPDKWIYAYDAWFFSRLEPIAAVSLLAFFIIVEAALLLRTDKALHFLALLLFFCLAMLFAQHHLMGVLYLVDRAGLFLIVLPLLLWFKALDVLGSVIWQGHQSRMFRLMWNLTLSVVFTVLITLEISKINYEGYRTWWDNSAVRPAMLDLYRECQFGKATDGRVTFGGTWQYRYAYDFYRELYKDDQLSAYHEIRELADGGQPAPSNLDFYLFSADFKNRPPNLELLKTFTASNVSLYVNSASRDLVPEGLNRTVRFGSRFPETAAGQ